MWLAASLTGENVWAVTHSYLEAVTQQATSTTLTVLESIRLDPGIGLPDHP